MAPPRIPLHVMNGANNLPVGAYSLVDPLKSQSPAPTTPSLVKAKTAPSGKPIPPEMLDEFKEAVDGSNLTKTGLIEVLKKRFPKLTRNTVVETLAMTATRVGKKEADKVWKLNDG